MRTPSLYASLAVLLVLSAPTGASAATVAASIGKVEKVEHLVEATYIDITRGLQSDESVFFNDIIRTYSDARFKATLDDGTELTLGENASVKIDDFVYHPGASKGELSLRVLTGAFLFVGGDVESIPGNQVRIQTPVGTLGIRGTTVWGGRIDDGYGILVLDGEVDVTTEGGSVTLRAGQATMIKDKAARPMAPHQWSEEKTARAVATISFPEQK